MPLLEQMKKLEKEDPSVKVVLEKWYPSGYPFTKTDYDLLNRFLKKEKPDFLLLSFESGITSILLTQIRQAGITMPVFTGLGDLGLVVSQLEGNLAGELYDLNVVGIPGTYNL